MAGCFLNITLDSLKHLVVLWANESFCPQEEYWRVSRSTVQYCLSKVFGLCSSGAQERIWTYCGQAKFVLNLVWTKFKNRTASWLYIKDRTFSRVRPKTWCGQVPMTTYVPAPLGWNVERLSKKSNQPFYTDVYGIFRNTN